MGHINDLGGGNTARPLSLACRLMLTTVKFVGMSVCAKHHLAKKLDVVFGVFPDGLPGLPILPFPT